MTDNYINYLEEVFEYIVDGKGSLGKVNKETFANKTDEEKRTIRWQLATGKAILICKKNQSFFYGPDPGHWEFFTEFLSIKPDNLIESSNVLLENPRDFF